MGWPHPDHLLERISSTQLLEWQAYYRLEPFGAIRDDFHTAGVVHMLAEINRDRKKHPKAYGIEDFVLFPEHVTGPPKKQSPAQMKHIAARIHAAVEAKQKRKKTM